MSNEPNSNTKYDPNPAMIFAACVYVGVVLAATTLFISFVLTAFPKDAYLSRTIMVIAGLLIGSSAIAFPVALHLWAFEKKHRSWTTAFYYGEILIMAINTVVSFMSLLGQHTDYVVPEWALLYEPFSVGAIVYTLFAWGTVFLLDPAHKRVQQNMQFVERYEKEISDKKMEFLGSIEGKQAIAKAALSDIEHSLAEQRNGDKHFISDDLSVSPGVGFVKNNATVPNVLENPTPSKPNQ